MFTSRLFVALSLGAGLSLGQIATAHFDCAPVGALPAIGGTANCDGCTGTVSATVSGTAACGFPTTGARFGRVVATGNIASVGGGGVMPRPIGASLSEMRIALPVTATGITFDWEFFCAETQNSTFNDGMNIAIVSAAGTYIQGLVSADATTPFTPAGCVSNGTSVLGAGPQSFSATLIWPRAAGAYLSIVCFNEGGTVGASAVSIDNVQFVSGNDACFNAILISEGTFVWTNDGATPTTANTTCSTTASRDVWFKYTNQSTCPAFMTLNTCPTPGEPAPVLLDTVIRVYNSCSGGFYVCNDDSGCGVNGYRSAVSFTVPGGQTRLIAVASQGGNVGGSWSLTCTLTNSQKAMVGSGCGSPAPILDSNLPQLGSFYTWNITNATPSSGGWLLYGPQAGATNIGGSCNLYLANSGLNLLLPVATDAAGAWSFTVTVPLNPALDCLPLGFQAFIGSTNGINLTNGLHVTLGF